MSLFFALLPLVVLACGLAAAMIVLTVRRSHGGVFAVYIAAVLAAGASVLRLAAAAPAPGGTLFVIDSFALFYSGLVLAAGAGVAVLAFGYLKGRQTRPEEFYLLLLGALIGAVTLVCSRHFASLFLGVEILSVALYGLIAYLRTRPSDTEAALKYLILSGVSSAFLLYGMALIYGLTGTMEFPVLARRMGMLGEGRAMAAAGMVFLVIGLGFKLGLVPFHMWTPDVYEGAPAPVTAFIATVSKGAVFALLLRYFTDVDLPAYPGLLAVFAVIAVASMLAGNLLALFQTNIKRLLAYSSIAHFGYLLVAFMSAAPFRIGAVTFYIVAYFVTTLGAFGVVSVLSGKERDADRIEDYEGLYHSRPWLAGAFAFQLLSLAGMPLTAGFIGKVYVVASGIGSFLFVPVAALIVGSGISFFYYLRVIAALYRRPGEAPAPPAGALGGRIVVAVLFVLLLWWGIYPMPLLSLIQYLTIGS